MKLFDDLIHAHNLTSNTLKAVKFENKADRMRGYFAVKSNKDGDIKFFIPENIRTDLPIRAKDCIELDYKSSSNCSDIVLLPTNPIRFKITPEQKWDMHTFIDMFAPFRHTNPTQWNIMKMISIVSYAARTYIAISSESEFGKTSTFDVMHSITGKCPVFKPRSVPGVLYHINGVGNLVFDEVQDCPKPVKETMEELSLYLAGGIGTYHNGALKSTHTKQSYDCHNQSITYLFNIMSYYQDPSKQFFDSLWGNRAAMDNRFLKLKFDGRLIEDFSKDNINVQKVSEDNKMLYIGFAKQLLWVMDQISKNEYKRRYNPTYKLLSLKGRKQQSFNYITFLIDMYANNQEEYDTLYAELEKCVLAYRTMVSAISPIPKIPDNFQKYVPRIDMQ